MSFLSAFLFTGGLSLAWQTYCDLKSKEVDSRRNWFMYGVLLAAVLILNLDFYIYFGLIIATVGYTMLIRKAFGEGDLEALRWNIPGFFMLNLLYGLCYLVSFSGLTVVYLAARRFLKVGGNTPGYTVILGSFIITAAIALRI